MDTNVDQQPSTTTPKTYRKCCQCGKSWLWKPEYSSLLEDACKRSLWGKYGGPFRCELVAFLPAEDFTGTIPKIKSTWCSSPSWKNERDWYEDKMTRLLYRECDIECESKSLPYMIMTPFPNSTMVQMSPARNFDTDPFVVEEIPK